jgi:biotin carboxylase
MIAAGQADRPWRDARRSGGAHGSALRHLAIDGLPTTAPLHRRILADPRFIAGGVDTGFLAGLNPTEPQP